jgi:hypothetical protein
MEFAVLFDAPRNPALSVLTRGEGTLEHGVIRNIIRELVASTSHASRVSVSASMREERWAEVLHFLARTRAERWRSTQ